MPYVFALAVIVFELNGQTVFVILVSQPSLDTRDNIQIFQSYCTQADKRTRDKACSCAAMILDPTMQYKGCVGGCFNVDAFCCSATCDVRFNRSGACD